MPGITNFPFLSPAEFEEACKSHMERLSTSSLEVALRNEGRDCFLVIRKPVDNGISKTFPGTKDEEDSDEGEEDDDKEALPAQPNPKSSALLEYHILLSPTYQLPVLYFQIIARSSGAPLAISLQDIYNVLVSPNDRAAVEKVGIIGGISQGDHPVLGLPYYFVHPCNTADAMNEWASVTGIGPEEYLRIWIGIVGGVVGLYIPGDVMGRM